MIPLFSQRHAKEDMLVFFLLGKTEITEKRFNLTEIISYIGE